MLVWFSKGVFCHVSMETRHIQKANLGSSFSKSYIFSWKYPAYWSVATQSLMLSIYVNFDLNFGILEPLSLANGFSIHTLNGYYIAKLLPTSFILNWVLFKTERMSLCNIYFCQYPQSLVFMNSFEYKQYHLLLDQFAAVCMYFGISSRFIGFWMCSFQTLLTPTFWRSSSFKLIISPEQWVVIIN